MILSFLLILALIAASGILMSSMILLFQLPKVAADSSDTNTDQENEQKNVGSGDSNNNNCAENTINSDTGDEDCTNNNQEQECKGGECNKSVIDSLTPFLFPLANPL
jgi:hypothetical protein